MTHNYTENNIVQFIYKECDLFDKLEMEFAMEDDSTLMESYETLHSAFSSLPKAVSPGKNVIDRILNYSRMNLATQI